MRIKEATVSRWRRGSPIDPGLRERVARELGISVDQLVGATSRIKELASSRPLVVMETIDKTTGRREVEYLGDYVSKLSGVPIVGSVPAGAPDEAFENYQGLYPVPREALGNDPTRCRVVRARGDSMVGLGICDGDMLAYKMQDSADDGDVVIADVEGDGITCKKLRKKKSENYLEAANPKHAEIHRPFRIVGKVVWRGGRPW